MPTAITNCTETSIDELPCKHHKYAVAHREHGLVVHMKFVLKDVGPFPDAEIKIDGLTVISGLNGTGKSTLLKMVYSILEGSQNLDGKLMSDVLESVLELMRRYVPEDKRRAWSKSELPQYMSVLRDRTGSMNEYDRNIFEKAERIVAGESDTTFHDRALYDAIRGEFVSTDQVIRRSKGVIKADVEMDHNSRPRTLAIEDKNLEWVGDYADLPRAIYYDSPFVMDGEGLESRVGHRQDLFGLLYLRHDDNIIHGVVNDEVAKRFDELVSKIVPGSFSRQSLWYQYTDEKGNVFELQNIAAGMKVFSLLKILMEKGFLNGNTVLLLDEPEVHLHPKWINILAEIICVLVKDVGVKVVMTTHLPQLLMSVEGVSRERGIDVDFYHLRSEGDVVRIDDISSDPAPAYDEMAEGIGESNRVYWGD